MLTLRQITLSRGSKVLLDSINLTLYKQQKIGLIGNNGCGKSTLFDFLLGNMVADTGEYDKSPSISLSHLSQEIPDSDESALNFVLQGDVAYVEIMQRLLKAEQEHKDSEVLACHELLAQSAGYSKPAKASTILAGLGFSSGQEHHPVNSFSGGWRMRLSLARCLMSPADIVLLDEPTNHLDMEAIFWLERYLKQCPQALILISHDREFLDSFVTHIAHVEQKSLTLYTGDYSTFEKTYAQKLALLQQTYEKQQTKIAHMMDFVRRFKAKATKAKQAQSRLKAIEKMETIACVQASSPFSFDFFPCERVGRPLIHAELVNAGYAQEKPILKRIHFSLNPGDRVALLGPNGEGKSTFIKTLTGELPPLTGSIHHAAHLHIGYYAQHQLEQLDCTQSPIQTIQQLSKDAREQTIRDFLGGFNFVGDMASSPITHFSGGEKARLALAKLVWLKPNLLLLDEPTNHLDIGMRSAIELALQNYEGALILISHDRHLLKTSVDGFYLVCQQQVKPFDGDLDDYYAWLQSRESTPSENKKSTPESTHKEKKALQNRVKKLEELIVQYQQSLEKLDVKLGDTDLYDNDNNKQKLAELLLQRDTKQSELLQTEEEWFMLYQQLDE